MHLPKMLETLCEPAAHHEYQHRNLVSGPDEPSTAVSKLKPKRADCALWAQTADIAIFLKGEPMEKLLATLSPCRSPGLQEQVGGTASLVQLSAEAGNVVLTNTLWGDVKLQAVCEGFVARSQLRSSMELVDSKVLSQENSSNPSQLSFRAPLPAAQCRALQARSTAARAGQRICLQCEFGAPLKATRLLKFLFSQEATRGLAPASRLLAATSPSHSTPVA